MKFWDSVKTIGRYQWFLITLFCLLTFGTGWANLGIVLFAPDIPFTCTEFNTTRDQCSSENGNLSEVGGKYGDISEYSTDGEEYLQQVNGSIKCTSFAYDHSKFTWTLTERFNLVCDREWIITAVKSAYMLGQLFGGLTGGILADKFGRKAVTAGTLIAAALFNIGSTFVPNIWAYAVLRFLLGASDLYTYLSMLVFTTESLRKDQRPIAKLLDSMAWDLNIASLGAIYFLTSSYAHIHILSCVALILVFLPLFFATHESPRWLTAKGKNETAAKFVEKITRFNKGKKESYQYMLQASDTNQGSFRDLFRTPVIRKRTLVLIVIWLSYIVGYYAITLNLGDFTEDIRISFMISGASGLFLTLPAALLMKKFGRSLLLFVTLLGAGICCFGMAPLVEDKSHPALITLALIGRAFLNGTFFITYAYTPELFPTVVRVTGLGVCMTVARLVSVLSPQLRLLNRYWPPFMVVTLGTLLIIAAFLAPLLPDMTDVELPQTIEDGEKLFAEHGYSLRKAVVNREQKRASAEEAVPLSEKA